MSTEGGASRVLTIPLDYNTVYALAGRDGLVLIDAGPDFEGAWEDVAAALGREGLAPHDVRAVLITHAHVDHAGLAWRWQKAGAEIIAPRDEAAALRQGAEYARSQVDVLRRFLAEQGVPPEALGGPPESWQGPPRQRQRRWRGPLRMVGVEPDTLVDDGDIVQRCGVALRVVLCSGHTPGNSVYLHEGMGALFSGDQLLARTTPNPGFHFPDGSVEGRLRSFPAYLQSLERLSRLPVRIVLPGHGEPLDDLQGAVERALAAHRRRGDRIEPLLREGPLTAYQVMLRSFPRAGSERLRQAMAEIIGQLDALVDGGRVTAIRGDDGIVRYAAGGASGPV